MYHRKEGLQQIAARVHGLAQLFASEGMKAGLTVPSTSFFDTVMIETPKAKAVAKVRPFQILETHQKHHETAMKRH